MKLKNIIISALAVATLASCVDLDYSEVTTNDEQWVYQSPNYGIQRLVTSLYARIPNGIDKNFEGGSGATFAAACDEADCALSNSNVRKLYNGGWSPINPFAYTWENSYKAIAEANNYLEKQYKIDLSAYENNNDYQAMKSKFELFEYEARFLRAWFYFELVRTYGDVPFTLKSLTNDQANSLSRTPAVEVMDWIVAEMDRIAEYLPVTYTTELNTDIGRATKPMCLALKARTLLYKASPLFNTAGRKDWWLDAARATHDLLVRADGWGIKLGKYRGDICREARRTEQLGEVQLSRRRGKRPVGHVSHSDAGRCLRVSGQPRDLWQPPCSPDHQPEHQQSLRRSRPPLRHDRCEEWRPVAELQHQSH